MSYFKKKKKRRITFFLKLQVNKFNAECCMLLRFKINPIPLFKHHFLTVAKHWAQNTDCKVRANVSSEHRTYMVYWTLHSFKSMELDRLKFWAWRTRYAPVIRPNLYEKKKKRRLIARSSSFEGNDATWAGEKQTVNYHG